MKGTRKKPWWRPSGKSTKRGRRKEPWSGVEEELVYKGVQKYGLSNWAAIHAELLPQRSNVSIKDKWRTMKNMGRLSDLASQFGPI